ncbi:MAG: sulfurtransferase [Gemmatimonadales bacterium]
MLTLSLLLALQTQAPRLVSVAELAGKIAEPKLVLLHVGDDRSRPVYDEGHIPGSQFFMPLRALAAPPEESGGLRLELPGAARLDSVLESHGVSDDSWVVLIPAAEYFTPTARAALTLEYAGLGGRVSVLDGGLEAWRRAGRPVTTEVPAPRPGRLTVRPQAGVVVDADFVARNLTTAGVAVVDARDTSFYRGAETRQGRNGHIKGARSVPFSSVVDSTGHFLDPSALRQLFLAAGVSSGSRVVTYCHIGQQASLVWFAAKLAGFEASLYDGSFQDWARRTDLPVEGSVARTP